MDRKTAHRYVEAAQAAGLVRDGGVGQVSDEASGDSAGRSPLAGSPPGADLALNTTTAVSTICAGAATPSEREITAPATPTSAHHQHARPRRQHRTDCNDHQII